MGLRAMHDKCCTPKTLGVEQGLDLQQDARGATHKGRGFHQYIASPAGHAHSGWVGGPQWHL